MIKTVIRAVSIMLCTCLSYPIQLHAHRTLKKNNSTPTITTEWALQEHKPREPYQDIILENEQKIEPAIKQHRREKQNKPYVLRDKNLRYFPLFQTFDYATLKAHELPSGPILFRNSTNQKNALSGAELQKLIERFFYEIRQKKTEFTDFLILKNKGFNSKKQAGMIVVKAKKYPFVVKLFMETPRSFIRPYNKGFEPACQWILGGGVTRHLLGFTRIKNLLSVKKQIQTDLFWSQLVDLPRKWFWTPKNYPWILLTGYNIGNHAHAAIALPGAYAIIADAIEPERELHLFNKEDRILAVQLSNFLIGRIDPHINNFIYEKNTHKLVIIDTEHFATMGGFQKPEKINSYLAYYLKLIGKCLKHGYFSTKKERLLLAQNDAPFCLP